MTRGETDPGGGPGAAPGPAALHIVRFAPAKLNLTLAVLGRRDDGYHSLHSVMVPLLFGDALTVAVAPRAATEDTLRVSGLNVSAGQDNLVLRAIAAVRTALAADNALSRAEVPPLSARLVKRTPVAAGLGGGSSDAAAAIEAALAAWQAALAPASKAAVAASLGSDVPFFLARGAAVISGRGELVELLPAMTTEPPAVMLVTPGIAVSTPAVFGAYAAGARPASPTRARGTSEDLAAQFRAGITAEELLGQAQSLAAANDLLTATVSVAPELEEFIRRLESVVGRPVCQSGSGPTQWVLYPNLADARKAVRMVRLAIGRGSLPVLGNTETFVAAAAIAGPFGPPQGLPVGSSDGGGVVQTGRANRPHTIHNDPDQSLTRKGDDSR